MAMTHNQIREERNQKPEGSWFVFDWDTNAYPIGLFKEEFYALRLIEQMGYGKAVFWEFGVSWDEINKRRNNATRS